MSNKANEACNRASGRSLKTVAAALAFSLAAGCSLLPQEEQPLAPPLVKPAQARIVTEEPRVGVLEKSVQGTAIFESVSTAYHRFDESGSRVGEVLVKAGDAVQAGDLLLVVEPSND